MEFWHDFPGQRHELPAGDAQLEPAPQPTAVSRVVIEFVQFPQQFLAPVDIPDAADEFVIGREKISVVELQQRPQDPRFPVETPLNHFIFVLIWMQTQLLAYTFGKGPPRIAQGVDCLGTVEEIFGAPRTSVLAGHWRRCRRRLHEEIGESV